MSQFSDLVLTTIPMLWLGLVAAISLIETPLKFRAHGVTLEIGLGIGRLVFHALNAVELALAALISGAVIIAMRRSNELVGPVAVAAATVATIVLLVQVFALRPALDERLDNRLRGENVQPSRHHVAYIVLEAAKLIALGTFGVSIAIASRSASVS